MRHSFFYLIFFAMFLALFRIIPHPPNFTPILTAAIVAPMLTKDRLLGITIPILAMFFSDIVIGFHVYQFAVYSSILIIALVSPMRKSYLSLGIMSVGSSVFFFITTNFAVWFVWDYYPKTYEGLVSCYFLALPFFKNTLISTCLFTALITISTKYLEVINTKTNNLIFNFIGRSRNNKR